MRADAVQHATLDVGRRHARDAAGRLRPVLQQRVGDIVVVADAILVRMGRAVIIDAAGQGATAPYGAICVPRNQHKYLLSVDYATENLTTVNARGDTTRDHFKTDMSQTPEEVSVSTDWSVDVDRVQAAMAQAVREHWVLFLVEGIALLVLGTLAIVIPPLATLAFTLFLGWLFVISGLFGLVTTFGARQAPGFWWSLVSAILSIGVGILMVLWPVSGAISLTLVLAAFFVLDGIMSIMYSLEHRQQLTGQWGWLLVSGLVDLVVAALIIIGFPASAAWAVGLLVGINMIFSGTSLIVVALSARSSTGSPTRDTTGAVYSR